MWFLLLAGVLGVALGLALIFFPYLLTAASRISDKTILDIETGSLLNRILIGVGQILIGFWLIWTSRAYPELWYLFYTGILALVFGIFFAFFPDFLRRINEWGNTVLFSDNEIGVWQRIIYGLIILVMGLYILYIYLNYPRI